MTVQDLPLFAAAEKPKPEPRQPAGYVGRVLERIYETTAHAPITPLDLAQYPDLYGTDYMRNLRHARAWLEANTVFTVACETANKSKAYWKYWLAIRDKE